MENAYENNYPLHSAAKSGDSDRVKSLLETGIEVDGADHEEYTALHLAAQHGHKTVVDVLLKNGANIDMTVTYYLLHPIHLAAKYGHLGIVKLLIENGASIDTKSLYDDRPIHSAAEGGHIEILNYFLENGMDVNITTKLQYSLLHNATLNGHTQAVEFLLSKKSTIDPIEIDRYCTPLHWAAEYGHTDIARLLIENGANLNAVTYGRGWTPIQFAARNGHSKIVQLLFEAGAKFHYLGDTKEFSPLHLAAKAGNTEILEYFFKKGASVNFQTKNGYSLLHVAAKYGGTELVKVLIRKGANVNCRTEPKGHTPLYFAARYCWPEVIDFLIQIGADFEETFNGCSLLDLNPKQFSHDFPKESQEEHKKSAEVIIKYFLLRNKHRARNTLCELPFSEEGIIFWDDCLKEIAKMENCLLKNTTVTLYQFLHDIFDELKLVTYLYNDILVLELQIIQNYLDTFRIYANIGTLISNKLNRGYELKRLYDKADLILQNIMPKLPVECRWEILLYFNNNDLHNFIKSWENSTKCVV